MQGINAAGFVTEWLVSELSTEPFPVQEERPGGMDQLAYEARLRSGISDHHATANITANTTANATGLPPAEDMRYWRYWYRHGSWFVDFSAFFGSLADIHVSQRTLLRSSEPVTIKATLWTFAAVELWVNSHIAARTESPVYKPIIGQPFRLDLPAGDSDIVLKVRTLGVRDTRIIAGLQLSGCDGISAAVPSMYGEAVRTARLMDSLSCRSGILHPEDSSSFSDFPSGSVLIADGTAVPVGTSRTIILPAGCRRATVECRTGTSTLRRTFELAENIRPFYPETDSKTDLDSHRRRFIARIAQREREPRSSGDFFSVFHVLARLAGDPESLRPVDRGYLLEDLRLISARVDCADFLVIGFVRLLEKYRNILDGELLDLIRTTLLGFRYWMDEDGSDGMCFWSENHAIMFHGAQVAVGTIFPNDVCLRSGKTGREQAESGIIRCRAWIADAEREGFEEFNSASYTPVTVAALLNLVDFCPEDISRRARALIDTIVRHLARHVFKASAIGPQGRVYRDVIYPFEQSVQALLNYIDSSLPCSDTEIMWNVCFATTSYRFPEDLRSIMDAPFSGDYISGNARIVLEKTSDYLLSCVRSPRIPGDEPAWTNLCFVPGADRSTNAYVKSLNERFHGTTVFRPGVYGYQQHLWYAALSNEAVVFATHPGSSVDLDGMRPGYWFGNGVMPAVNQRGPVLAAVYGIPEEHPIGFIHLYWPAMKFDETEEDGAWRFARSGDGYLGLWCSASLSAYDDMLSGCELRSYTRSLAFVCIMGCARQDGSLSAFRHRCVTADPVFDTVSRTVSCGALSVTFFHHHDTTQVV